MLHSFDTKSRRPTCDARRTAPIVVHASRVNRSVPLFNRRTYDYSQTRRARPRRWDVLWVSCGGRLERFLRSMCRTQRQYRSDAKADSCGTRTSKVPKHQGTSTPMPVNLVKCCALLYSDPCQHLSVLPGTLKFGFLFP